MASILENVKKMQAAGVERNKIKAYVKKHMPQDNRNWKQTASDYYTPTLEGLGGAGGAALGAVGGLATPIPGDEPLLTAIGGTAGYGLGKSAARGIDRLLGLEPVPETFGQGAMEVAQDLKTGAMYELGGQSAMKGVGLVAKGIAYPVKKAYSALKKLPSILPDKAEHEIAKKLVAWTSEGPVYAKNLDDAMRIEKEIGGGFKFATGKGANDPKFLQKARVSIRGTDEGNRVLQEHVANNDAAIVSYYNKTFNSAKGGIDDVVREATTQGEKAGQLLADVVGLSDDVAKTMSGVPGQAATGESIYNNLSKLKRVESGRVGKLFDALPNAEIGADDLVGRLKMIVAEHNAGGGDPADIPIHLIKRIVRTAAKTAQENSPDRYIANTMKEIMGDYTDDVVSKIKSGGLLNSDIIAREHGAEVVKELQQRHPGLLSKKGAIIPDEFAFDNGFDGLDDMIQSLLHRGKSEDIARAFGGSGFRDEQVKHIVDFKKLRGWRSTAGGGIRDNFNNNPNKSRLFGKIQAAITDSIDNGMEGVADYANARGEWAKYVAKFRQGPVGEVLKRGNKIHGGAVAYSDIPGKFFATGKPEYAAALIKTMGLNQSQQQISDYAMYSLYKKAYNPMTGELSPKAVKNWVHGNSEVLKKFNLLKQFSQYKAIADDVIKAGESVKEFEKSALHKALKADPEKIIPLIFSGSGSRDSARTAIGLLQQLKGNPEAIHGLKNSFADFIITTAQTTAKDLTGSKIVSPAAISKLMAKYGPAMKVLYASEPAKLKALQNIQKAYEISTRGVAGLPGGSDTAENILQSIVSGVAPFLFKRWAMARGVSLVTGKVLKIGEAKAGNVLLKALFDPQYAKELTDAYTLGNKKVIGRVLDNVVPISEGAWRAAQRSAAAIMLGVTTDATVNQATSP